RQEDHPVLAALPGVLPCELIRRRVAGVDDATLRLAVVAGLYVVGLAGPAAGAPDEPEQVGEGVVRRADPADQLLPRRRGHVDLGPATPLPPADRPRLRVLKTVGGDDALALRPVERGDERAERHVLVGRAPLDTPRLRLAAGLRLVRMVAG